MQFNSYFIIPTQANFQTSPDAPHANLTEVPHANVTEAPHSNVIEAVSEGQVLYRSGLLDIGALFFYTIVWITVHCIIQVITFSILLNQLHF
jgi:hypothetical protein